MKHFIVIATFTFLAVPAVAAPKHHALKKHHTAPAHTLDEATRKHIFLLRSQTLYLAAAQFPGGNIDPKPQDEYQDRLLAQIDRRCGITEAQGSAIDTEGATRMWPIMGADGHIDHIH